MKRSKKKPSLILILAAVLLVLLPLSLYFQDMGLVDTYVGLIWVYQLIALPLILWIVRGYFEDISPDIEYAYRIAGHSWFRTFFKIAVPLVTKRLPIPSKARTPTPFSPEAKVLLVPVGVNLKIMPVAESPTKRLPFASKAKP